MKTSTSARQWLPLITLAYLVGQNALTFFLGTALGLMGFMGFPILLFLAGIPPLVLVPLSLVILNREVTAKRRVRESRGLFAAVCVLTALLFFWSPISDVGFRVLEGNRLQRCAIHWLETPETPLRDPAADAKRILSERGPECLQPFLLPPAKYVTRHGTFSSNRYVALSYGGGFGHWGLMIGGPALEIDPEEHQGGLRKMWPGFYAFDSN